MTRDYFVDCVDSWSELICFSDDCGFDLCSNIYDGDGKNDLIQENLGSIIDSCDSWMDLRDTLYSIDSDDDGYYMMGDWYTDWDYLSGDDFDRIKEEVLEAADESGEWEDDESEEIHADYGFDPFEAHDADETPSYPEDYKPGDIVIISDTVADCDCNSVWPVIADNMRYYAGMKAEIRSVRRVDDNRVYYSVDIDRGQYCWSHELLEKCEEDQEICDNGIMEEEFSISDLIVMCKEQSNSILIADN